MSQSNAEEKLKEIAKDLRGAVVDARFVARDVERGAASILDFVDRLSWLVAYSDMVAKYLREHWDTLDIYDIDEFDAMLQNLETRLKDCIRAVNSVD